jgi:hypothetical protein
MLMPSELARAGGLGDADNGTASTYAPCTPHMTSSVLGGKASYWEPPPGGGGAQAIVGMCG